MNIDDMPLQGDKTGNTTYKGAVSGYRFKSQTKGQAKPTDTALGVKVEKVLQ